MVSCHFSSRLMEDKYPASDTLEQRFKRYVAGELSLDHVAELQFHKMGVSHFIRRLHYLARITALRNRTTEHASRFYTPSNTGVLRHNLFTIRDLSFALRVKQSINYPRIKSALAANIF